MIRLWDAIRRLEGLAEIHSKAGLAMLKQGGGDETSKAGFASCQVADDIEAVIEAAKKYMETCEQ